MADYVYNRLFVHADDEVFAKIILGFTKVYGGKRVLSLDLITPQERHLEGNELIDWRIEHWGTKWDVWVEKESFRMAIDRDNNSFYFHSAWNAPLKAIQELSARLGIDVTLISVAECIGRAALHSYITSGVAVTHNYNELHKVISMYAEVEQLPLWAVEAMHDDYHDECEDDD